MHQCLYHTVYAHTGAGVIRVLIFFRYFKKSKYITELKGIVSRDFGGLQMILMNRIVVPDVPLDVYLFLNFCFHIVF